MQSVAEPGLISSEPHQPVALSSLKSNLGRRVLSTDASSHLGFVSGLFSTSAAKVLDFIQTAWISDPSIGFDQ